MGSVRKPEASPPRRVDSAAVRAPLAPGEPAPWFKAATLSMPDFLFDQLAGRYVLVVVPGPGRGAAEQAIAAVEARPDLFDNRHATALTLTPDPTALGRAEQRGLRHFADPDGAIARRFGADGCQGLWLLFDPALRLLESRPFAADDRDKAMIVAIVEALPPPERHAGQALAPPVLLLPRLFDAALCDRLIDAYKVAGGAISGYMREVDGRTVGLHDTRLKSRRDHLIEDAALKAVVQERMVKVAVPAIHQAFQFRATRMERYLVACYDAEEGGRFQAHRDNTTPGTAHRRFAMSVNLNAGYDGGDIWFPEFAQEGLRPPPGGAVIFSCSLLHAVRPVTAGRRYAFLPFFYDDAAAEQRRVANIRLGQALPAHGAAPP